jgi:hypothetical protein
MQRLCNDEATNCALLFHKSDALLAANKAQRGPQNEAKSYVITCRAHDKIGDNDSGMEGERGVANVDVERLELQELVAARRKY